MEYAYLEDLDPAPVSYTHLDVYKRQGEKSVLLVKVDGKMDL